MGKFGGRGGGRGRRRRKRDYENEEQAEAGAREALGQLRPLMRELSGFDVDAEEARLRQQRAQRYESSEIRVEQTLGPVLRDHRKAVKLLRQFKARWQITRDPDERYWPQAQVKAAAILAAALVPELGVNIYAFGQHQANVLSGAVPATLPILVILLMAFLTVQSARWVTVRSWPRKLLGGSLALVGTVTAILGLIAAAHYRDDYAASASADLLAIGTTRSFIDRMGEAPLDLSSMSWWLLLFSLAAFMFTCFHLWNADDPHPGYGKKARSFDSAEGEAAAIVADLQNETKAIADVTRAEAEGVTARRESLLKEAIGIAEDELYWQGIPSPESYAPTGDEPRMRRELLRAYAKLAQWIAEMGAHGGLVLRLGCPPGEDPDPYAEPREITSLVHAVGAEEAWLWLDRVMARAEGDSDEKEGQ